MDDRSLTALAHVDPERNIVVVCPRLPVGPAAVISDSNFFLLSRCVLNFGAAICTDARVCLFPHFGFSACFRFDFWLILRVL